VRSAAACAMDNETRLSMMRLGAKRLGEGHDLTTKLGAVVLSSRSCVSLTWLFEIVHRRRAQA